MEHSEFNVKLMEHSELHVVLMEPTPTVWYTMCGQAMYSCWNPHCDPQCEDKSCTAAGTHTHTVIHNVRTGHVQLLEPTPTL